MEINKGIETFDDRMDVTRTNKDRKPFGKSNGTEQFNLGNEYDVKVAEPEKPAEPPKVEALEPPKKFTHKLANGTVLEAATVEELAMKIESAFKQQPAIPVDFEDKPLYQPYEFKPKELSLAEQAEILNVWKENPQKAMRMLQEADLGAPASVIIEKLNEAQRVMRQRAEEEAAVEFLGECDTYNPTTANGKKLTAYLREKQKPITKQNLVLSFQQLVAAGDKTLLRKVEEQAPPESAEAIDESLTEVPQPPTVVPSNQGRPEAPPQGQVDVAKFANLSLDKQKEYFASLRRR